MLDDAPALAACAQVMRAAVARDGHRRDAARCRRAAASACRRTARGGRSAACSKGVATHLQGDAAAAQRLLEEGARRGAIVAPGRAGALPRPARPARDRRRRLGAGAPARRPRPVPGRAPRPRRPSDLRAGLRRIGVRARTPGPRRGRPIGPPARHRAPDPARRLRAVVRRRGPARAGARSAASRRRDGHADAARRGSARAGAAATRSRCCAPGSTSCGARSRRSR